ncbi:MAG: hypothetical protein N3D84_01485, partial [Candidatus Woesearchaeota archaeon]|nr:hypothetical protein [Candidatus Woesearchaeota archaeon]
IIGCSEVRIYDHDLLKRKIGLQPRIVSKDGVVVQEGAFVNRLGSSSSQRVLYMENLRFFEKLKSEDDNSKAQQIFSTDKNYKIHEVVQEKKLEKSVKRNPKKQKELELYCGCMEKLFSQ